MAQEQRVSTTPLTSRVTANSTAWIFSWPLVTGIWVYLYSLRLGNDLLFDGDTYWHITTGQWIMRNGTIPMVDPYSHTKGGAVWTAHEWLSEVILAVAHQIGGWTLVVAVTGLAFAATVALLTRALLKWLEPIYALLFAGLAVPMTAGHLLARPHILAMPLLMIWTIELVRASESTHPPRWWVLPAMTVWANLHGGFIVGIGLACAFALEAVLTAPRERRVTTGKSWGIFIALAVSFSLLTPHGAQGILFTWQILFDHSYALERIGEWRSPSFQTLQPLELWLLGGLALVLHQGLRLPPIRLVLLLGLLHLSLKHIRHVEMIGLLAPLFLASPFAAQWRERQQGRQQLESADRFFRKMAQPAGQGAILISFLTLLATTLVLAHVRPIEPPEAMAPVMALKAVKEAGIKGPVLNNYSSGGYLIYVGIPPFIDGRNDVYGDAFFKQYVEALELKSSDSLPKLLAQYKITWTLLTPESAAVSMLDTLPQWRRLYADNNSVVHVRTAPPATQETLSPSK